MTSTYATPIKEALDYIKTVPNASDLSKISYLAKAAQTVDAPSGLNLSVGSYHAIAETILKDEGIIARETTHPDVRKIIEKIKRGRNGSDLTGGLTQVDEGQKPRQIEAIMVGNDGRSIATEIQPDGSLRTTVEAVGHVVIDVSNFTTVEELDRALYEARRAKRIGNRLEHEQNMLATAMLLELTDPKEASTRSPFDCLREPWTMASWPTPPNSSR